MCLVRLAFECGEGGAGGVGEELVVGAVAKPGETFGAALAELGGLYHLSASGVTTWHDFARAIIAGAGFESRVAIRPLLTSEYPTAARRPAYSVLDGRRFCRAFGWAAPAWPSGLQRCLAARDAVR